MLTSAVTKFIARTSQIVKNGSGVSSRKHRVVRDGSGPGRDQNVGLCNWRVEARWHPSKRPASSTVATSKKADQAQRNCRLSNKTFLTGYCQGSYQASKLVAFVTLNPVAGRYWGGMPFRAEI